MIMLPSQLVKLLVSLNLIVTDVRSCTFVFNSSHATNINLDSNWKAPWKLDDLCTPQSKAIFPRYDRVPTIYSRGVTFSNILFGDTGLILFVDDQTFNVTLGAQINNDDLDCDPAAVFKYKMPPKLSWHNVSNWSIVNCHSNHLLHSQQVPSTEDSVIFVSDKVYRSIIKANVNIKKLTISNTDHTTESFYWKYAQSVEGQLQFEMGDGLVMDINSPVLINEFGCDDIHACIHYNINPSIMDEICGNFGPCAADTQLPCQNSITPVGHCCPICGSMVVFHSDTVRLEESLSSISKYHEGNRKENKGEWEYSLMRINDDPQTRVRRFQLVVSGSIHEQFMQQEIRYEIDKIFELIRFDYQDSGFGSGQGLAQIWSHSSWRKSQGVIVAMVLLLILVLVLVIIISVAILQRREMIFNGVNRPSWMVSSVYKRADLLDDQDEDTVVIEAVQRPPSTSRTQAVHMSALAAASQNKDILEKDDSISFMNPAYEE